MSLIHMWEKRYTDTCAGKESYRTDPCARKESYRTDTCARKETYCTHPWAGKGYCPVYTNQEAGREVEQRYCTYALGVC